MWGIAQRETTRRCASDWGHNSGEGRVKIPLIATSHVPNSVTLPYTAHAVFTGSTCATITYLLVDRKGEGRKGNAEGNAKEMGGEGRGGEVWTLNWTATKICHRVFGSWATRSPPNHKISSECECKLWVRLDRTDGQTQKHNWRSSAELTTKHTLLDR